MTVSRNKLDSAAPMITDKVVKLSPLRHSSSANTIESIAKKMQSDYIMKQSLSDEQMKELHASLHESFIKLDQHFHYLAGMLSNVAKNKKIELVGFYFSKLNEACVNCHSQYAIHKFPAFILTEENNGHSH